MATLVCQKDSFLCAARGVSIGIAFQKKIGVGLFGGEGFIMQRLQGDGFAFVHAGGMVHRLELAAGETLRVDTGCLVGAAALGRVRHPVRGRGQDGAVRRRRPVLRDPDRPGQRLAAVAAASAVWPTASTKAPRQRPRPQEEGSVLDVIGLGNLIDGD